MTASNPARPSRPCGDAALRAAALTFAVALAACSPSDADATTDGEVQPTGTSAEPPSTAADARLPSVPSIEPVDALSVFAERAEHAPTPPDEARETTLRDLVETAFLPGYATPRLAGLARDELLAEDDATRALEQGLRHDDADVRIQCAWQLGQRADPTALPPLVARLRDEVDRRAQLWICDAMWRLGCDTGLEFLPGYFRYEDTANDAGRSAMERIRHAGLPLSEQPTWEELGAAIVEIHDHWRLTGRPLVGGPEGETPHGGETPTSEALYGRLAKMMLEFPREELRGVDIARAVLRSLGRVGLPLLRTGLRDRGDTVRVRFHTLEIVERLGPAAHDLGPEVLALVDDPICASLALRALGELGYAQALPHLLARLASEDPEIAVAAAAGLGGLRDARAIAPLRTVLDDAERSIDERVWTAASLALLVVPDDDDAPDPGLSFLEHLLETDGYHRPTLEELVDRTKRERRLASSRWRAPAPGPDESDEER
jgi:hypothetical protein